MNKSSGTRTRRCAVRVLSVALTTICLGSCGRLTELQHTFQSAEALASAVLEATARSDRSRLESLALSEQEFHDIVWPELPAARPERNVPWDYVWQDLNQKSRAGLSSSLAQHGGRRYELVSVRQAGQATRHASFEVRRDTELVVRDESGQTRTLRLFGSMLVMNGQHKLFSYVVD